MVDGLPDGHHTVLSKAESLSHKISVGLDLYNVVFDGSYGLAEGTVFVGMALRSTKVGEIEGVKEAKGGNDYLSGDLG